jgi:hypothetical protein
MIPFDITIDLSDIPNKYHIEISTQRYREDMEDFISKYPIGATS